MVAASMLASGEVPRRGDLDVEPKFWRAWCRGVEREDLVERQFDAAGSAAHAEVEAIVCARKRAEWGRLR
jgi:hypothetical protein